MNKIKYKTYVFDDYFKLREKNLIIVDKLNNLGIFDVVIFNYSKPKNKKKVINYFKKKRSNFLFNISLDKKNIFTGPSVINFF